MAENSFVFIVFLTYNLAKTWVFADFSYRKLPLVIHLIVSFQVVISKEKCFDILLPLMTA